MAEEQAGAHWCAKARCSPIRGLPRFLQREPWTFGERMDGPGTLPAGHGSAWHTRVPHTPVAAHCLSCRMTLGRMAQSGATRLDASRELLGA